jgi:hypothetical protein
MSKRWGFSSPFSTSQGCGIGAMRLRVAEVHEVCAKKPVKLVYHCSDDDKNIEEGGMSLRQDISGKHVKAESGEPPRASGEGETIPKMQGMRITPLYIEKLSKNYSQRRLSPTE